MSMKELEYFLNLLLNEKKKKTYQIIFYTFKVILTMPVKTETLENSTSLNISIFSAKSFKLNFLRKIFKNLLFTSKMWINKKFLLFEYYSLIYYRHCFIFNSIQKIFLNKKSKFVKN